MQGFGALGQFGEIAVLEGLGERVEKRPNIACLEGVMPRLALLTLHIDMPAFTGVP